jgi:hypothetical protein
MRGLTATTMVVVIVFIWMRPGEPRAKGRPLSSWLRESDPRPDAGLRKDARIAIYEIGFNAEPYLMRLFSREDSKPKQWIAKFYVDHELSEPPLRLASQDCYAAALAFEALGPSGAVAIPELEKMLNGRGKSWVAALALSGIGPMAIPALTNGLRSTNAYVRRNIMIAAWRIHPQPASLLISQLHSSTPLVRHSAAFGLQLRAQWNTNAYDALTNLVSDADQVVREQAADALKSIDWRRPTRMNVP